MADMAIPDTAPPTGGIIANLWSLLEPDQFITRPPTASDLRYRSAQHPGIAPLADVYLPDVPGPHPSVVLFHGGGFVIGSKTMKPMRFLASRLAEAGFAVMVFDYRMIFQGGRMPECIADGVDAVQWWQSQAERFHLDPARISLAGLSAGATLMLRTAGALPGGLVSSIVSVFGIYDFTYMTGRLVGWMRRLLFRTGDLAIWLAQSPITTTRTKTPLLLLHGTADSLTPIGHAVKMAAMRQELGLPVETVYFDGAPHAFFNDARTATAKDAVAALVTFLQRQPALTPVG